MKRQPFVPILSLMACLAISAAAATGPEETGTIAGVVRFTGTVPPATRLTTTDGGTIEHNDLVVDPKTKGLRHVAAVLEDAPAQPRADKAEPVLVDQRDMLFIPRVIAVQHGRTVRYENNDLCNHSVLTVTKTRTNQYNTVAGPGRPTDHVYEAQKPPIMVGCALHGWMRAWVYVVPHPWCAVTDARGRFRIENVPPGEYTLWLRHPDTGLQEKRTVRVAAGHTAELSVVWMKVSR